MRAYARAYLRDCILDQVLSAKKNRKWENDLPWLEYNENYKSAFVKLRKASESKSNCIRSSVCGSQSHFITGNR